MGAQQFDSRVSRNKNRKQNAKDAFDKAVSDAAYDHGHSGYTGTIAEKENFVMIPPAAASWDEAEDRAEELFKSDDPRIDDKWGPAGCIEVKDAEKPGYYFFGWASS